MAFGCVLKYLRETLYVKTLILCDPRYCCQHLKQLATTNNSFSRVGHFSQALANYLLSKAIGCPFYINTPLIAYRLALVCTSNDLVKLGNLKMGEVESLSFNTPTL
jgi:hypothetical protein